MDVTRGAAVLYCYLVLQCFHVGYVAISNSSSSMATNSIYTIATTSSIFPATSVNTSFITPSTTQVSITSPASAVPTNLAKTTAPPSKGDGMLKNWEFIVIGVAVGVGCFLVLAIAFVICYKKKKSQVEPNVTETAHGLSERVGDEHHLVPPPIVKEN